MSGMNFFHSCTLYCGFARIGIIKIDCDSTQYNGLRDYLFSIGIDIVSDLVFNPYKELEENENKRLASRHQVK